MEDRELLDSVHGFVCLISIIIMIIGAAYKNYFLVFVGIFLFLIYGRVFLLLFKRYKKIENKDFKLYFHKNSLGDYLHILNKKKDCAYFFDNFDEFFETLDKRNLEVKEE